MIHYKGQYKRVELPIPQFTYWSQKIFVSRRLTSRLERTLLDETNEGGLMRSIGIIPRLICYSIAVVSSKISALEWRTITTTRFVHARTGSPACPLVIDWLNAFQTTIWRDLPCKFFPFFFFHDGVAFQNGSLTGHGQATLVNVVREVFRTIEARTGVLSGAVDRYLADNDTAKARRINWLNELIEQGGVMEILSPWIFSLSFSSVFENFFSILFEQHGKIWNL